MTKHLTDMELWNAWADASAELHQAEEEGGNGHSYLSALYSNARTLERFMSHDHAPETEGTTTA